MLPDRASYWPCMQIVQETGMLVLTDNCNFLVRHAHGLSIPVSMADDRSQRSQALDVDDDNQSRESPMVAQSSTL